MNNTEKLNKMLADLGCETKTDLVKLLNKSGGKIKLPVISRWGRAGMHKSTQAVINAYSDKLHTTKALVSLMVVSAMAVTK